MTITIKNVPVGGALEVRLGFEGIATYKVLEFAMVGSAWKLDKTLQSAGHSHDAQADNYALTPVAAKDAQRLIYIAANMSSVTGEDDVSMHASFLQGSSKFHEDTKSGKDDGNLVQLIIRVILKGA